MKDATLLSTHGGMSIIRIMVQMITGFQVFRAATVTSMVSSLILEAMVSGGLLLRTHRPRPGTATWITTAASWARATTLSELGLASAVSGIRKEG